MIGNNDRIITPQRRAQLLLPSSFLIFFVDQEQKGVRERGDPWSVSWLAHPSFLLCDSGAADRGPVIG